MAGRTASAPVVLVAAGGLAREAAAAARAAGREVRGALDDRPHLLGTDIVPGLRVLGTLDAVGDHTDAELVICAGKGTTRAAIADRLAARDLGIERYTSLIHPSVEVPEGCTVGRGSVLLSGVVLTADVTVGDHVVCMPQVVLTHDCVAEDFSTLCAGVILGGAVRVGRAAYVGMAASVRENRQVGAEAVIGMGSVVLRDVPDHEVWAGVPARRLGHGGP